MRRPCFFACMEEDNRLPFMAELWGVVTVFNVFLTNRGGVITNALRIFAN